MDGGLVASALEAAIAELAEALGEGPGRDIPRDPAERLRELAGKARDLFAEERRSRQAAASFRAASLALSRTPDSGVILEDLLDYLNWIVAYDAAQVFLSGGDGDDRRTPRAAREWRSGAKSPLATEVASLASRAGGRALVEEREGGRLLYLPLRGPDGILGEAVIAREGDRAFDEAELREAEAFAGQAAAALRSASLYASLQKANAGLLDSYETSIELLSKTLDLRDRETEGHSQRVADMSTTLARAFGMDAQGVVLMRRGALLHDIGKIGIPDAILLKPGPLDDGELDVMRRHPAIARELFLGIPFLRDAIDIPWCHHEWWDGSGYPRGVSGNDIPLSARVFAVVDVWDALTHDRPYRKALGEGESLKIISKGSGSHFDPVIVQFFLASFDLI